VFLSEYREHIDKSTCTRAHVRLCLWLGRPRPPCFAKHTRAAHMDSRLRVRPTTGKSAATALRHGSPTNTLMKPPAAVAFDPLPSHASIHPQSVTSTALGSRGWRQHDGAALEGHSKGGKQRHKHAWWRRPPLSCTPCVHTCPSVGAASMLRVHKFRCWLNEHPAAREEKAREKDGDAVRAVHMCKMIDRMVVRRSRCRRTIVVCSSAPVTSSAHAEEQPLPPQRLAAGAASRCRPRGDLSGRSAVT